MIRVLIYLVIVALLAFGAVWLAERPGDVVITWQGERVETSVMVLMAAAAAVAVAAVLLWSIARAIVRSPDAVSRFLRNRRGVRAYQAVSHGLIAVGSGDARAARKFTTEARRIAPDEPLTLAAERAGGAARGQPRRGRRHLPADGGTRRHQGARPARPVRRGASPQRPGRRIVLCRGGRQAVRGPALGRAGGAGIPLHRRRLERSAGAARAQHEERADRQDRLPAPARRAAHRAGARRRGRHVAAGRGPARRRSRARAGVRARGGETRARPGAGGGARRAAAWRVRREAQGHAHHRGGVAGQSASRSRRRLCPSAARRFRARAPGAGRVARRQGDRRCRGRDRGGARRARRQGVCHRARGAGAAGRDADAARGGADGGARAAGGRRRPRPRMDGARRSTRAAIPPGPPTDSCRIIGFRSRPSPAGSMPSSGATRLPASTTPAPLSTPSSVHCSMHRARRRRRSPCRCRPRNTPTPSWPPRRPSCMRRPRANPTARLQVRPWTIRPTRGAGLAPTSGKPDVVVATSPCAPPSRRRRTTSHVRRR